MYYFSGESLELIGENKKKKIERMLVIHSAEETVVNYDKWHFHRHWTTYSGTLLRAIQMLNRLFPFRDAQVRTGAVTFSRASAKKRRFTEHAEGRRWRLINRLLSPFMDRSRHVLD